MLRIIYGPCGDMNKNKWRHNSEIEQLYGKKNIVRSIKSNRLRRTGHVVRCANNRHINRVFWQRPDGNRLVGRPRKWWKDVVAEDLKRMRN